MFQSPGFLRSSNIYEVNIRQYTTEGTFTAFSKHLPRLREMGVEILWLMPVHPIGRIKRKGTLGSYYSIRDFNAVNPEFGTGPDLQRLVENAHASGIKVILDWVANHASWDNVWTTDHPEYFSRNEDGSFISPDGWDDVIQIDHKSLEQQTAMINTMAFWVSKYDMDGFRADLAHLTPLSFWINARTKLQEVKSDLIWLAETEDATYHQAFDISFTWNWMHTTEKFIKENLPATILLNCIQNQHEFPDEALRLFFTSNHDENSWNGTEYEKYKKYALALAVCSCTLPYSIPLIYSGQEIPNNKRLKFFDKDTIEWKEDTLGEFYARLLYIRKHLDIFRRDAITTAYPDCGKRMFVYLQNTKSDQLFVVINFDEFPFDLKIDIQLLNGRYVDLFSNSIYELNGNIQITIPPAGYTVLYRQ